MVGASILLPMLFLIPLPASLWNGLPGRELMVRSLELVGANDWATLSVDPIRTLLALTALITPLALLTIGWTATRDRLVTLGWIVIALGLANMAIGIPQVLSSGTTGLLYPENPMPGVMFGSFANRNSTGLMLVAAMALAALLPLPTRFARAELVIRASICALLLVAVILTRSRSALVLALVPLALACLRMLVAQGMRRAWLALAPLALVALVAGALVTFAPGRVGDVMDRFNDDDVNARAYIWEDASYAAARYWPVGAGTGVFDEVFQIDESLENMTLRRAGRAHNDYLEVAIEAGLPGLALVAGWLLLVGWLSWRARTGRDRWVAWSGAAILLVIALQSITDYPLRNQTLLAVGGYALLILARFGASRQEARR
jgi:O-antigen ligase